MSVIHGSPLITACSCLVHNDDDDEVTEAAVVLEEEDEEDEEDCVHEDRDISMAGRQLPSSPSTSCTLRTLL